MPFRTVPSGTERAHREACRALEVASDLHFLFARRLQVRDLQKDSTGRHRVFETTHVDPTSVVKCLNDEKLFHYELTASKKKANKRATRSRIA